MNPTVARTMLAFLGLCASGAVHAEDAAPMSRNANPLSAIDPASLTGFRERPLFSPSRSRPPVSAPQAEPDPAEVQPETLDIHLLGIIGTQDGLTALVLDLEDESRHSLRLGETFHGWTVSALNNTEMVISRNEDIQRFPIFKPAENRDNGAETSDEATP